VALAAWDRPDRNMWASATPLELIARGMLAPPGPEAPGMFALADQDKLGALLSEAGFTEIEIDILELQQRHESFDRFWEVQLDLAAPIAAVLGDLDDERRAEVRAAVAVRLEPFTSADGTLRLPGSTVVAAASA
jgi:hypothetical protein